MLNVQNKNSSYFVEWIPNNVLPACVTFLPEVSRWPPPSWATPPPFRRSARGFLSSSLLCSGGRLSFIGTQARAWTRTTRRTPRSTLPKTPTPTAMSLTNKPTKTPTLQNISLSQLKLSTVIKLFNIINLIGQNFASAYHFHRLINA